MSKPEPRRIWTARIDDAVLSLELHDNGVVFYRESTRSTEALFFVDQDFIAECFASTGRKFDATKMPANFVAYPENT